MRRCHEIFKADEPLDDRRAAVELLRVVADRRVLDWVPALRGNPDPDIQTWGISAPWYCSSRPISPNAKHSPDRYADGQTSGQTVSLRPRRGIEVEADREEVEQVPQREYADQTVVAGDQQAALAGAAHLLQRRCGVRVRVGHGIG